MSNTLETLLNFPPAPEPWPGDCGGTLIRDFDASAQQDIIQSAQAFLSPRPHVEIKSRWSAHDVTRDLLTDTESHARLLANIINQKLRNLKVKEAGQRALPADFITEWEKDE